MEVMAGYRQTEVGVIPEDWDTTPLGNYVRITSGESPSLIQFTASGKPYFKVEQLGNCEKYLGSASTPYHFINGKTVPRNSVIFAKRGAAISLNRVRLLSEDSFMDTNLMALTSMGDLDHEFLYYGLGHIGLWQFADTTSVPQINNKHVKPLIFPIPPLPEQRAIAAALSDVDALQGGLERLIAKKRDLKQATMQQLLTGQTRLPGFSEEWEVKRLGGIAKIQRGASPRPIDSPVWFDQNSSVGWVRISDVTCSGMFLNETTQRLSPLGVKYSRPVATGSLIMSICATVGRPIITKIDVCIHDGFVVFDNLEADQLFIYYVLKWIEPDWMRHGQTGSQMNLNTGLINGTVIKLPPRDEQTAIADVLSDMDAELAALEARRDKTRALKQAMMQELLTGKTRLVPAGGADA